MLDNIIAGIVTQIILWGFGLILPILAAMGAKRQTWKDPNIILYGVGTFALGLIVINQFMTFRESWSWFPQSGNHGQLVSEEVTKANIQEKIRQWLIELGYAFEPHQNPDTRFNFAIVTRSRREIGIYQRKNIDSFLSIGARLRFPDSVQMKLSKLTEEKKDELVSRLKTKLAELKISYPPIQLPLIEFADEVFIDNSLTRAKLFDELLKVEAALVIVSEATKSVIGYNE